MLGRWFSRLLKGDTEALASLRGWGLMLLYFALGIWSVMFLYVGYHFWPMGGDSPFHHVALMIISLASAVLCLNTAVIFWQTRKHYKHFPRTAFIPFFAVMGMIVIAGQIFGNGG